jgi:hypothetical protein
MKTSTAQIVAPHASPHPVVETLSLSLKQNVDVSVTLTLNKDFCRNSPVNAELMLTRKMLDDIFANMPLDFFEE